MGFAVSQKKLNDRCSRSSTNSVDTSGFSIVESTGSGADGGAGAGADEGAGVGMGDCAGLAAGEGFGGAGLAACTGLVAGAGLADIGSRPAVTSNEAASDQQSIRSLEFVMWVLSGSAARSRPPALEVRGRELRGRGITRSVADASP